MMMLVERYLVICNPLAGSTFNIQQSMIASACCWLWSFIWCFLPLVSVLKFQSIIYQRQHFWLILKNHVTVGWNSYVLEGIGTSCAPNWYVGGNGAKFTITFFIVVFITPILVKIYLFGMTLSFIKVKFFFKLEVLR